MAIDVASWLQQLGLAQYELAFRDNEVDGDVLPDLTAEDLIGLGVTLIGHRRKLLSAIAALGAAVPAPSLDSDTGIGTASRTSASPGRAPPADRDVRTPATRCRVVCLAVKPVGEPDSGNRDLRFDERRWETG